VSFDGLSGEVKIGKVATKPSEILQVLNGQMKASASDIYQRFSRLLGWADKVRTLGIRANADQPDQSELAYAFGARGIGLCRTEHMFFGEGRIEKVQRMILADNEKDRRAALAELLPLQRGDFYGVLKAMHGEPVTIRTIDPPLARVPAEAEDLMVESRSSRRTGATVRNSLRSADCCTGSSSSTSSTRCSAIAACASHHLSRDHRDAGPRHFRAACQLAKEGIKTAPEVMIPLVGHVKELKDQKTIVDRVAAEVMKEQGVRIKYLVGTMIEVPRGAVTADEIAHEAQFFSFGTNDLTQMTFGSPRRHRQVPGHLPGAEDPRPRPFQSIDTVGVGQLVRWRWRRDGRRGPTSSSASVASTAAIRPRCTSSTKSA